MFLMVIIFILVYSAAFHKGRKVRKLSEYNQRKSNLTPNLGCPEYLLKFTCIFSARRGSLKANSLLFDSWMGLH